MNIAFLSGLFPEETKKEIITNSKGVIQNAANTLQWSFVKGFDSLNIKPLIINLVYIGSYPFRYKKAFINKYNFNHNNLSFDVNLSFLNLPLIKLISRYFSTYNYLKEWVKSNEEDKCLIIYAMHTPFLLAASRIKKKNRNLKVCLIVPDLPEYMSDSNNILYKILKNADKYIISKTLVYIDFFVLLTKDMSTALNIEKKPWICIEGIADNVIPNKTHSSKEKNKTILYTGTLAKRYGILDLVEAFSLIKDETFRLWICGDGDTKEKLIAYSKVDKRIKYLGQLPREEILDLQRKATLLVNPRKNEGEYVKYSFPSKIMEYMVSGTPCLIHKLPGIPDDYYNYTYTFSGESIESIRETLEEVCNLDPLTLHKMGEFARDFILKNKNPRVQVKKLVDMLNSLYVQK